MAWRTCAPSLPRSTHECARGLGQKDVVRDPNFFASALDHLTWPVDEKKVHVAGRIFSGDGIRQVTRNSNTGDLPPSRSVYKNQDVRLVSCTHPPSGPIRHVPCIPLLYLHRHGRASRITKREACMRIKRREKPVFKASEEVLQ